MRKFLGDRFSALLKGGHLVHIRSYIGITYRMESESIITSQIGSQNVTSAKFHPLKSIFINVWSKDFLVIQFRYNIVGFLFLISHL